MAPRNPLRRSPRRAALISPLRRLKALIERDDAETYVARMPSVELNRAIAEIGLIDATELLALATPTQLREVVDMQTWDGDRINHGDLLDWIFALTQLPEPKAAAAIDALDVELLGFLLRAHTTIYLLDEQQPPDEPQGLLWATPDGWFALDIALSEARALQIVAIVSALYARSVDDTRRLLQNLLWELPDELEEWSLRWRSGRLSDLGFADPIDALSIYAYLDPRSVTLAEKTADRAPRAEPPAEGADPGGLIPLPSERRSFWLETLATVSDAGERARLGLALMHTANRTLSADRIASDDLQAGAESLEQLHGRISLGLEYLSRGDLAQARRFCENVALSRVARVGHSLLLELRRRLQELARSLALGTVGGAIDRLGAPFADRLPPLLASRPQLFDDDMQDIRPFFGVEDLHLAQHWLRQVEAAAMLVPRNTLPPDLPPHVTLGDLFRTWVVNATLQRSGPIDASALSSFIQQAVCDGKLLDGVAEQARRIAQERDAIDDPTTPEVISLWLAQLEEAIGSLHPDDANPHFVGLLWFRTST